MNDCERIRSMIPFAVRGELDENVRSNIRIHITACPACSEEFEFELALQEQIDRHPLELLPDHYYQGVLEEIHLRMPILPPRLRPRRDRRRMREIGASAVLAATALIWFSTILGGGTTAPRDAAVAKIAAPPAERRMADAAPLEPMPMVLVKGFGWVAENSPLLKMPPEMLRELGLMPAVRL